MSRVGGRPVSDRLITHFVSGNKALISNPDYALTVGQPVEYYVTLPVSDSQEVVRLHCVGRVVSNVPDKMAFIASIEQYDFVRDQFKHSPGAGQVGGSAQSSPASTAA